MKLKSYNFGENILNAIDVSKKQINYILKYSPDAIQNQNKFFKELNIENLFNDRIIVATPFSNKIKRIANKSFCGYTEDFSNCKDYDGVITSMKNTPLFIAFGDCPQLMVVGDKDIGIIHAARNTLDNNILQKFFKEFLKNNELSKTKIGFSPYIFKKNFGHKYTNFKRKDFFKKFTTSKKNLFYLDLKKAIVEDLKSVGIGKKNILDFKINTYKMSRISSKLGGFEISHRQSRNKEGRGGAVLMLK